MKNEWHCARCGKYETTREGRRKHRKCPPTQLERVQRALAFQDPEWIEELKRGAAEGNGHDRRLLLQKGEADRDFALLQKQYDLEVARMAAQGLHLDGTPIETEETKTEKEADNGEG